jgi:hypothetical protein
VTREPRVTVLTAHSDEPQLPQLLDIVARQEGVDVIHKHQRFPSFRESQAWLHSETLAAAGTAAWVVILDGDMVPVDERAIMRLLTFARLRNETRRLTTPVYDHYTRSQLMGVHLVAPEALSHTYEVSAVVHDRWVTRIDGTVVRWIDAPQIRHAPRPSLEQAVRFGLQRGHKARLAPRPEDYWILIDRLAQVHRATRDATSTAVAFGAAVGIAPEVVDAQLAAEMEAFDDRTAATVAMATDVLRSDAAIARRALGIVGSPSRIARWHARLHGSAARALRAYLRARYLEWHSPIGAGERLRPLRRPVTRLGS